MRPARRSPLAAVRSSPFGCVHHDVAEKFQRTRSTRLPGEQACYGEEVRRLALVVVVIACGGRVDSTVADAHVDSTATDASAPDAEDAETPEVVVDCPANVGVADAPVWAVAHWSGVPYGLAVSPAGRILVSGSIRGGVDLGGGPLGSDEMRRPFALLLNAQGKYLASHAWKTFDGPPEREAYTPATTDGGGGFRLGLSALGPRTFGASSFDAAPSDLGVYVLHLDADAKVESAVRFAASPTPEHFGVVLTLHGNGQPGFTLSGGGPVDWGAKVQSASLFVGRYDESGKLGAYATVPASYGPMPALPMEDGGVILSFGFEKTIELQGTVLSSKGGPDIGVARFDANGKLRWVIPIRGASNDIPLPMTRLQNGNVLVGTMELSDVVELGNGQQSIGHDDDGGLIEISPDGTIVSFTRLGPREDGYRHVFMFDARPAGQDGVLISGEFLYGAKLGHIVLHTQVFRGFIARRSASGDFAWARCFSDAGLTLVYGVAEMPDGGVVAAIYSDRPLDFGAGPIAPSEPKPPTQASVFTIVRFPG